MDKFMVFDVESIGLHGDGFAVAWVVVNREGERLGEGCMACPRDLCAGTAESRLWVDENVPALDQVQFSVTSHRGCFGGCAFCGISTHQGKIVQSRSRESILREVREIAAHPDFKGTIRDIGGATANMWQLHCRAHRGCDRPSCLAPEVCRNLETGQRGYVALLEEARKVPGVRHVFISSGIRGPGAGVRAVH